LGYSFYHQSESEGFVAKNGVFLKKESLTKEMSGRIVQLDEIDESSATVGGAEKPEVVLQVIPTTKLGVAASDAETSVKSVAEPCRSGRV
jgi:hypothetical protein